MFCICTISFFCAILRSQGATTMSVDCMSELKQVYKSVIKRIVDTGVMLDSDVLFLHFYKTNIEQNTNLEDEETNE